MNTYESKLDCQVEISYIRVTGNKLKDTSTMNNQQI